MEPSLTRGEYWLLQTVVEWACPLCFLDSEGYHDPHSIEQMFNKPGHGLNRDRLIATLEKLFQEGWIMAKIKDEPVFLTRHQIINALDETSPRQNDSCTYYRLTPKGGEVWEAFATPDWSRFILEDRNDETHAGVITSMIPGRLEKYLRSLNLVQYEVDFDSAQTEEIGPWDATYWKVLPNGHRTRFQWSKEIDPLFGNDLLYLAFCGFCDFRDEWYRWA
jgi:hypothetical protein